MRFKSEKSIAKVISDVNQELFEAQNLQYDVIIYGNETRHIKDVTSRMTSQGLHRIRHIQNPSHWSHSIDGVATILTESYASMMQFLINASLDNEFPMPLKYPIYIEKSYNESDLQALKPYYYLGHISQYVYYIINTRREVHLKTFEWWTEKSCGDQQLVTVNSFNKTSQKWKRKLQIKEKFKNFHKCQLLDGSMITNEHLVDGSERKSEGSYPFFKEIYSKVMVTKTRLETAYGEIFAEKGNYTQVRVSITHPSPDIQRVVHPMEHGRFFHQGMVFHQEHYVVMIPRRKSYSSYEKIFFPFDTGTWICILITIVCAFCVIFIVNLQTVQVQELFYGRNTGSPVFNVIGSIFGVSQHRLPLNYFARLLLILFTVLCLIMRTAYQGELTIVTFHH